MSKKNSFAYTDEEGIFLVKLARNTLTTYIESELIKATTAQGRLDAVEIGKDGLIIEMKNGSRAGLFLPQVPVEWHWDVQTYLEELCGKAWLPDDKWKRMNETNLYKFQGEIFSETKPKGEIVRKTLQECCD